MKNFLNFSILSQKLKMKHHIFRPRWIAEIMLVIFDINPGGANVLQKVCIRGHPRTIQVHRIEHKESKQLNLPGMGKRMNHECRSSHIFIGYSPCHKIVWYTSAKKGQHCFAYFFAGNNNILIYIIDGCVHANTGICLFTYLRFLLLVEDAAKLSEIFLHLLIQHELLMELDLRAVCRLNMACKICTAHNET